jgi:hypothetical protein
MHNSPIGKWYCFYFTLQASKMSNVEKAILSLLGFYKNALIYVWFWNVFFCTCFQFDERGFLLSQPSILAVEKASNDAAVKNQIKTKKNELPHILIYFDEYSLN